MEELIKFSNKIARLDWNDEYYDARQNSLEIQKKKELDAVFSMKTLRQKSIKKYNKTDRLKHKRWAKMSKNKVHNWIWSIMNLWHY